MMTLKKSLIGYFMLIKDSIGNEFFFEGIKQKYPFY